MKSKAKKILNQLSENQIINESSLSRIYRHTKEHDSGTISAFRSRRDCDRGESYTQRENNQRSYVLKNKLLSLGYGVTKTSVVFIENYGTPEATEIEEISYLVVDINDKGTLKEDLIELGRYFDQDSITFSNASDEYYLISTNTCPNGYPGKGTIGVEKRIGVPVFGKSGETYSKINGRPFVFEPVNDDKQNMEV